MSVLLPNTVKYMSIMPYGNPTTVTPDGIVDFYFPAHGFLDLKSLSLWYDVRMGIGSGNCCWPRDAESVIQCLEVFVNGQMVNCIQNYQQLWRILSDFGYMDIEEVICRQHIRNCLTNGVPAVAAVASINGTYQARKWLGLFEQDGLIDLSENQIHMRITISPRQIIISPSVNDTYSLSNVYLTCKYFETYTGDLKKQISFADYKSVIQYNPTTTQETYLKIFTKNVDYVVGTILKTNYTTISTALSASIASSRFFERNGNDDNYAFWNFKVNQRPVYNYQPRPIECFESMYSILPKALRSGAFALSGSFVGDKGTIRDSFAVGAKVGFQNEEPEEVELSFITAQGSSSIANFSLFFAKMDNTITLN